MNRVQFMGELKNLLSDISETERREALEYYESYFDDAGVENEASVIRELGSPGKVAAIIKADLNSGTCEDGEGAQRAEHRYQVKKKRNTTAIVLIILGVVLLSPFLIGAAGSTLGVLITVALVPVLIILGLILCIFGLLAGAIACVTAGVSLCFSYPAAGILTIGVGCFLVTGGILALVIFVWLIRTALPWIVRKVTDLLHNLLNKNKGEKDGVSI